MKKIIAFILSLFIASSLIAIENKHYKFEYITTNDGLSQSTIESIFQDSKGIIWIGTRDGVNRYNGRSFEILAHNNKDTTTIGEGWVNTICEDYQGNIWIGTNSGISVYNYQTKKIRRLPQNMPGGNGKITCIISGPDNKIWYGLAHDYKLVRYDIDTDEYKVFEYNNLVSGSPNIFDIIFTKNGKMFLAPESDELLEFDTKQETFIVHNYVIKRSTNNYKKSIVESDNGELYIAAENAGVHIYDPKTKTSRFIEGLNNLIVKTKVLFVSPTEVWIGTDGGGINIYNPETGSITYMISDNKIEQCLAENTIFNMLQDRDGNIWVGHYGAGLSVWKKYKEKFQTFKNNPFNPTSLPKQVVTAIFEDSKGRLWSGHDGGGLALYNPEQNNFTKYTHIDGDSTSLSTNVIICIEEDNNGHLILGTYAAGAMIFDPETEKVIKNIDARMGLTGNGVWDIYEDKQGRFWFACLGGGVDIYDPSTETIFSVPDPGSTVIMKIVEAPDGKIWFGSENGGISVLNPEDYTHYMITSYEDSPYRLSGNDVKSILFSDNIAWIGLIGGGLNKINLLNDSVSYYSKETGLSSNSIMSILQDQSKNLWISSTDGLMKFNPTTEEVVIFDKSQGTQGNEYKYNADFILSNNYMAFGGAGGFSIFHPDSIKDSPIVPALTLSDFKLYNESATIGEEKSVLHKHINATERIVLTHKHKVFSFEFASLDYTAPNKNRYRYKLDGYDEDWIESGNKNYASYTNVSPGRYTFMLMGSNSDGVWSEELIQVKVRIKPPFYKTKLFIILLIGTIAYFINLFIRARIRQNKHDKAVLQKKIDEGKAEVDRHLAEIDKQQEEIRLREESERELRFTNTGIVKMSEIISKNRAHIDQLSQEVISGLTEFVGANAGVMYITNQDNEGQYLQANASYCYDTSEEENDAVVRPGVGYVGTCYVNKKRTVVSDMPDGKIVLRSGLGEYSIRHIYYIPILQDKNCFGILEIASIEPIEEYKLSFVEKISDNLGSVLAIDKANKSTKKMLEQNQMQSEELKAQEEELRMNIEEMQATQEEFQRQLDSVDELQEELDKANETIKMLREKEK